MSGLSYTTPMKAYNSHTDVPLYPLFLDLHGRHCLVVGLGKVAQRKLSGLLPCQPASILVLDTADPAALSPEARALSTAPTVRFEQRSCTQDDVRGCALVFAAATAAENLRIAEFCRAEGIACNCASAPECGTFQVPAVARKGELAAALSTGGASPALARRFRAELEDWLDSRARTTRLMGRLRPLVLALGNDTRQNTKLFRTLAFSPLQQALHANDAAHCRRLLEAELPVALHVHIAELLDDLP